MRFGLRAFGQGAAVDARVALAVERLFRDWYPDHDVAERVVVGMIGIPRDRRFAADAHAEIAGYVVRCLARRSDETLRVHADHEMVQGLASMDFRVAVSGEDGAVGVSAEAYFGDVTLEGMARVVASAKQFAVDVGASEGGVAAMSLMPRFEPGWFEWSTEDGLMLLPDVDLLMASRTRLRRLAWGSFLGPPVREGLGGGVEKRVQACGVTLEHLAGPDGDIVYLQLSPDPTEFAAEVRTCAGEILRESLVIPPEGPPAFINRPLAKPVEPRRQPTVSVKWVRGWDNSPDIEVVLRCDRSPDEAGMAILERVVDAWSVMGTYGAFDAWFHNMSEITTSKRGKAWRASWWTDIGGADPQRAFGALANTLPALAEELKLDTLQMEVRQVR